MLGGVSATFIDAAGRKHEGVELAELRQRDFVGYLPVRDFGAHREQEHLPGYYFFSSVNRLIAYESRLEMFHLMDFDFSGEVVGALPQPLRLAFAEVKGAPAHTPDFLIFVRGGGMTLVDVKPRDKAGLEKNRRVFALTEGVCNELGWRYEVRVEHEPTYLSNLKWLAGYREPPPAWRDWAEGLIEACGDGQRAIGDVLDVVGSPVLSRPTLFHLLWKRVLVTDMQTLLQDSSPLWLGRGGGWR